MKFRFNRHLLEDSMKTVCEFNTLHELLDIINKDLSSWSTKSLQLKDLVIEHYCFDTRINWDTYMITAFSKLNRGVIGFTNGKVLLGKKRRGEGRGK